MFRGLWHFKFCALVMAATIQCCSCSQSWAMPACRGGCLDLHRAKWAGWHRSTSKVSWSCDTCCCNWGVETLLAMEIARSHMDAHLCTLCMQMPKPRWFAELEQVAPGPPGPTPPFAASGPPPPPPENDDNPWQEITDQESPRRALQWVTTDANSPPTPVVSTPGNSMTPEC